MRKIAIAALILFTIAILVQDFFKDKRAKTPVAPRPYIVLLSLDGFRYDYQEKTNTPTFDSIQKNGVRAKGLQPIFPSLTFPNHYAIATGLYAGNHGLVANNFWAMDINSFYSPANNHLVKDGSFYKGEPIWVTAESNRIKSASFFWLGTEVPIKGYQPSKWKAYNAKVPYHERLDSVVSWLSLPYNERPHLITCYIELTDNVGHTSGPDSPELTSSVQYLDSLIGTFTRKINHLEIKDSINFIIVSDHGMAPTDTTKIVRLDDYIKKQWVDTFTCSVPFAIIYSKKKCDDSIKNALQNIHGIKAWKRTELPERYHLAQSKRVGDVIISADSGWCVQFGQPANELYKGAHGYDNLNPLMNGVFYAIGPSFKQGYAAPQLYNIDIYSLLCQILNIKPAVNDGDIKRIEGVLK